MKALKLNIDKKATPMKFLTRALLASMLAFFTTAAAAEEATTGEAPVVNQANSLEELLRNVEQRRVVEARDNTRRVQRFQREKAEQARLLKEAEAERTREEQRSDRLETTFEENEIRIGERQEQYDKRLGSLRELFGVLQQVAGDTRGLFEGSIISAQYPNRGEWLGELAAKMGTASQLATIEEMEDLWFELQREMTETGKIVSFPGTVTLVNGDKQDTTITRVGAYALLADGDYIRYDGDLVALARQPAARFTNTVADLQGSSPDQVVPFAVDPTRGSLLSLLIQAATLGERVGSPFSFYKRAGCFLPFCDGQGGMVGAVIIIVGFIALLLIIERLIVLLATRAKVNSQRKSDTPSESNPLGRVLKVYHDNKNVDVETLELKLGEAILSETPKLSRNITIIQVISVVAPLMGLLGTVIGMILTFQAITLFGTGDPKTMAGGISTALMTTVLGLVVAIPTTFGHAIVASLSKSITHVLEEQSAGIIAEHAERSGEALG